MKHFHLCSFLFSIVVGRPSLEGHQSTPREFDLSNLETFIYPPTCWVGMDRGLCVSDCPDGISHPGKCGEDVTGCCVKSYYPPCDEPAGDYLCKDHSKGCKGWWFYGHCPGRGLNVECCIEGGWNDLVTSSNPNTEFEYAETQPSENIW